MNQSIPLLDAFHSYIKNRMDRLKQEIYHEKLPMYRRKLLNLNRRLKLKNKSQVETSPTIILDLIRHRFTSRELAFLARGSSFIEKKNSFQT